MAPTRPSIMSLGATTSAPASAWLTAVRASSSRLRSLSTSPSTTTPQWPWDVYSHRQTSVSRTNSGKRGRSARNACWTIPSSSQAPVASSSFSAGTPKSSKARTPLEASVSTSRSSPSTSKRAIAGSASLESGSGATKSGITNWSSESRVSRTSPRSVAVRRKRRSRGTGNALTPGWYAAPCSGRARRRRLGHGLVPTRGLETDLDERLGPPTRPLLERGPLGEELPGSTQGRQQRQRDEDSREAVDLAAGEQAEGHEQRMEPQSAPHHLRHDDMPLELLDAEEEKRDPERGDRVLHERVQHRRGRPGPRADGRAAPRA